MQPKQPEGSFFLPDLSPRTYLHKQGEGLIVDGVRVVKLAIVPHDLPQRRVLLGHGEHPWWVAALREQLPAQKGGELEAVLNGRAQTHRRPENDAHPSRARS